jgi:hypothetical protein
MLTTMKDEITVFKDKTTVQHWHCVQCSAPFAGVECAAWIPHASQLFSVMMFQTWMQKRAACAHKAKQGAWLG